ncbi:MAG: hypothetical protein ABFS02_10135 [Pseudomonadota bacterium]
MFREPWMAGVIILEASPVRRILTHIAAVGKAVRRGRVCGIGESRPRNAHRLDAGGMPFMPLLEPSRSFVEERLAPSG